MISRYSRRGIIWIDLESPTKEEIDHTIEEFGISRLVGEEMVENTMRSKVDLYSDYLYLVLHFPVINKNSKNDKEQEVDFIVGERFVITVRYESVEPLKRFSKIFESDSLEDRSIDSKDHGAYIFMQMMKEFYKESLRELESLTETINFIERQIFGEQDKTIVRRISIASKKLLDFKQAIRFHGEILASYESASKKLFGHEYAYYSENIRSEYNKVSSILEGHRETIAELQLTNSSLLSTRSNEIMSKLTAMAFIMFTLTVFVGIFSMNIKNIVLIESMDQFYTVLVSMVLIAILMFAFFKLKKWM